MVLLDRNKFETVVLKLSHISFSRIRKHDEIPFSSTNLLVQITQNLYSTSETY